MRRLCLLFPLLILAAGPVLAATDIGAAIRACRAETDDARRLACYDRVAEGDAQLPPRRLRLRRNPRRRRAAAAPPPQPPQPLRRSPRRRPRKTTSAASTRSRPRNRSGSKTRRASLGELEAYVTGIETRMDGLMTITLDNGQVWRQNSPDSKFHLKEGDRVKIQPGSMNSFILSGPSKKSTRVTRVK